MRDENFFCRLREFGAATVFGEHRLLACFSRQRAANESCVLQKLTPEVQSAQLPNAAGRQPALRKRTVPRWRDCCFEGVRKRAELSRSKEALQHADPL